MGEIADALRRSGSDGPVPRPEPKGPRSPRDGEAVLAAAATKPLPLLDPSRAAAPPASRRVVHICREESGTPTPARVSALDPHGPVSQQFLRIAFRLRDRAVARNARSIVLTSAEPFEGKTTTACNLATQLAKFDHTSRVVLVDLDLHRASVATALGIRIDRPIDAVIRGDFTVDEALIDTDIEGLSILGLDRPSQHADQLLADTGFKLLLADLTDRFDFVIIDSPPVLTVPDAQLILRRADAGILVTLAGSTSLRMIRNALEHLPAEKLLGTILNGSPEDSDFNRYGGYYGNPAAHDQAAALDQTAVLDAPDAAAQETTDANVRR